MSCPACTRLDRDEALLTEAVEDLRETRRFALTEEERQAILEEERLLAHLLDRIIEARAA